MKVWYDGEVDILYVSLRRGLAYDSEELSPDVRVEYEEKGKLIGIEVMNSRTSYLSHSQRNRNPTQRNNSNKNTLT